MSKVRYEVSAHVAQITMDSAPVNALSVAMIEEILSALKRASADDDVRAIVLCSALPRRFCAGLDLSILQGESGLAVHKFLEKLYIELADVHYNLGKPCIAAVDGAVRAGGMTLCIQSNVIVAGESSTFGYPEIDVGMIPAIHFVHLPRIVGRHRAYEILFSGAEPRRTNCGAAPLESVSFISARRIGPFSAKRARSPEFVKAGCCIRLSC